MSDAISRSAALEMMDKYIDMAGEDDQMHHAMCVVAEGIKDLPALDVAPVVRCNVCKHYEQDTGFCQYYGTGNRWDGFCNNGARMDGEEND